MTGETRSRAAAGLVTLGLGVEAAMLLWRHPLAFLVFAGPGLLLLAAGMLLFLAGLLRGEEAGSRGEDPAP